MERAVAGVNHRVGHDGPLKMDDFVGQVVITLMERTLKGGEGVLQDRHKKPGGQPRGRLGLHGQRGLLRLGGVQRLLHGELQNEMWLGSNLEFHRFLQNEMKLGLNLGLHWHLLDDYWPFACGQPRQQRPP